MQRYPIDTSKVKKWYQSPEWSSMPPSRLMGTGIFPEVSGQDRSFLRKTPGMTPMERVSMHEERVYPPLPSDSESDEDVITSR